MYQKHVLHSRLMFLLLISLLLSLSSGCATQAPDPARMQRGYVYYCDGAGGGGLVNWSGGVRDGLIRAGYEGGGTMFRWETGLGVLADQTASNTYKRDKASKLAQEIIAFRQQYPNTPITLIGLSAGTVITVFALEELPSNVRVENVILLSGSLSSTHNLTRALEHVTGTMYISTSQRDMVLGGLLPFAGTADRGSGTADTIGVQGPHLPSGASAQTRALYADKVHVIPWKPEFAQYGNRGGHTDTVSAAFIARYVAPLVTTTTSTQLAEVPSASDKLVANPDYQRWASFAPGSWILLEGTKTSNGVTESIRIKTTLINKTASCLVFQRDEILDESQADKEAFTQTLYESARIQPNENPMTSLQADILQLPDQIVCVGDEELLCKVQKISAPEEYSAWGSQPMAKIWSNANIPSGIVRIEITTRLNGAEVNLRGKVIQYHIAK